jgi:hypothetical protein
MTTVIDLTAELAKLTLLRGRTPQTTSADRAGSSAQLAPYRDGGIFTSKFSGKGAWERHMHIRLDVDDLRKVEPQPV